MQYKLPAIQFYPGDWKKDIGVQSLTYEERGIWFEILLIMHESEQRGKLVINGRKMDDAILAQLLHLEITKLQQVLNKLITNGVASLEQGSNILICRRMLKEEHLRKVRSDAGIAGMESRYNKDHNKPITKSNPSSSSSSSFSSSKDLKDPAEKPAGTPFKNPKQIDLKDIPVIGEKETLNESAKHKLFNTVIDLFRARGWDTEGEMPLQVFRIVSEDVSKYKPKEVFPYFKQALKNYLNQNSDMLAAQTKINWGTDRDKKRLLDSPVGMTLQKTMKSLQPKEA